jgi:putative ABC transport system ATP-binding protein
MKQRVQLARSLAVDPEILLMDEPFAALDAQTRDVLQEELQEIWQRTGKTVVFVTHNVREAQPVLKNIAIKIEPRSFVVLTGPSGCGKSTLLNIIAGLDTPTDGDVSLAGEALVGKSEDELAIMRRRHIGIVFQFFNLLEGMSVLENVTLPAVIAGAPRKRAETRARDLLDLLGLADKAKDAPGVLSGGQRQRLAIARALANEPTLVLADEPTGALDSEGGHEVLELFRRLHAGGQTILMVTHDDEVAAAADRIVRMRDGRIETEAEEAAATAASVTF